MKPQRNIGGQLDYAALAQANRPTSEADIAREVRRLHAEGLTPRDIASALHLALPVVLAALSTPTPLESTQPIELSKR